MGGRGGRNRSGHGGSDPIIGDVYGVEIHPDRWGACQIVDVRDGRAALIGLDAVTSGVPDPATVARAEPLAGGRGIEIRWVGEGPLPRSWHRVANLPLATGLDLAAPRLGDSFGSSAGVEAWLLDAYLDGLVELTCDHAACQVHQDAWPLTEVVIDLGSGPIVQRHVWPKLRVAAHSARTMLRWTELEQLPCLSILEVDGPARGVAAMLERTPRIRSLTWSDHRRRRIDLRSTNLRSIELVVDEPVDLRVNDRVRTITVAGDPVRLRVRHPLDGAWLRLDITATGDLSPSVEGLADLHRLTLRSAGPTDLRLVGAHPGLRGLAVHGDGSDIVSPESLGDLTALRSLWLSDCWRLDADALPRAIDAWPDLERVVVLGFASEDRSILRRAFAGVDALELRGGKARAQLEAESDNPFRHWVDEDPKAARVATRAWIDANRHLDEGRPPEAVLTSFVEGFDAVAAGPRGLDIETAWRDDIASAHAELAAKGGIDAATASSMLDEHRGDW